MYYAFGRTQQILYIDTDQWQMMLAAFSNYRRTVISALFVEYKMADSETRGSLK